MNLLARPRDPQYATGVEIPPYLDGHLESNRKGIHIIGAAAGAPLLKICINQGVQVLRALARIMPPEGGREPLDLVIVGAGPAGLAAALEARKRGYSFALLEQGRALNTLVNYPAGKHVYAEPATLETLGELDFEDATKEELLTRWGPRAAELEITAGASVRAIEQRGRVFHVACADGRTFPCKRVILAMGRMGDPRKLGVPGEDLPCVFTSLLNPGKYQGRRLLVVGGGNSAVEAALALARSNRVTLAYRGPEFTRIFRSHRVQLERAATGENLQVLLETHVLAFRAGETDLEVRGEQRTIPCEAAFVLIGAEPPLGFFRRLGIAMENAWTGVKLAHLAWVFALVWTLYGIKFGLWPLAGVHDALAARRLDPSFLYGILYTALVTAFGLRALRKYRRDPYQVKRYTTLIAAQWLVYFLLPWGLFFAGYSQWGRIFGVVLTYPLGYYALWEPGASLFAGSALPWAIASLAAFLLVMPVLSIFHGKRFCSWFCPCGALADTVGDAWRQNAPRGKRARKVEISSTIIMLLTFACSFALILDYRLGMEPDTLKKLYKALIDIGLASVIAITLYPFKSGRIWCRFFCPLAKWMELWGRWSGGKLAIVPNDECISCGECTRYCQMGIDVRAFAQREQPLSNESTSCVFCGICVTVCPVDVLAVRSLSGGTRSWRREHGIDA